MAKDELLSLIPLSTCPLPTSSRRPGGLCSAFWQPFNASVFHIAIATFPWGIDGQVSRFLSKQNWEMNIIWPLHVGHGTQPCPHPSPECPGNRIPLSPGWLASTFPEIFGVFFSSPSSACPAPPCHMCSPKHDTDTSTPRVECDLYRKE